MTSVRRLLTTPPASRPRLPTVGYSLLQSYDGNGLRVKKNDNGTVTYYLRSSVLGGQVVTEIGGTGALQRSYVYLGGKVVALKQSNSYYWIHEDPVTKSKRVVDRYGAVVSTVEMDPWGADTSRSSNAAFQPRKFTSYDRDANGTDEAMFRRYNRWQSRFDQPDPYEGSYSLTNPQSFNRYAYVQNDPVNFVDPSGLDDEPVGPCPPGQCDVTVDDGGPDPLNDSFFRGGFGPAFRPVGGGGPGGVGPGGAPQEPAKPSHDKKSACANFVDKLMGIIEPRLKRFFADQRIGKTLYQSALNGSHNNLPFDGFHNRLTNNNQGSGVYRHILGGAASVLVDSGRIGAAYQNRSDRNQRDSDPDPRRRAEAQTELAGTAAGQNVGGFIRDRFNQKIGADDLRKKIFAELCDY